MKPMRISKRFRFSLNLDEFPGTRRGCRRLVGWNQSGKLATCCVCQADLEKLLSPPHQHELDLKSNYRLHV